MKKRVNTVQKEEACYQNPGAYGGVSVWKMYPKLMPIACSKPGCPGHGHPTVQRIVPSILMGPPLFWNLTILCEGCAESLPIRPPAPPMLQRLLVWKQRVEFMSVECVLNEVVFRRLPDILAAHDISRLRTTNRKRIILALSDAFNLTGTLRLSVAEFEKKLVTVYGFLYGALASLNSMGTDQAPKMQWPAGPLMCHNCGEPMVLCGSRRRFCSNQCSVEHRNRIMLELRLQGKMLSLHDAAQKDRYLCLWCDKRMERKRKDQKFCSKNCKNNFHNQWDRHKIGAARMSPK